LFLFKKNAYNQLPTKAIRNCLFSPILYISVVFSACRALIK
jgi:hypothetical protein